MALAGFTGAPIHIGAAGLPDFGISEKIQQFFAPNKAYASSGGSNLFGATPQQDYSGSVLGSSTGGYQNLMSPAPIGPTGAPAGYKPQGGGSPSPIPQAPAPSGSSGGSPGIDMNSAYNDYLSSLDQQLSGLNSQRSSQEQIANNTYQQGYNTATNQFNTAQQQLDANRQKTLRDLGTQLQQQFQQGNAALGVRGASDSSAANQYAFALAKLGSQQRGDVQSQYDQNLFNLKNTYDTETKNLELEKNNQLQQIAQWFSEAQNQIGAQKGALAQQRSQQALSIAMQMAQQVQDQANQKASALTQWATNHATNFQQLASQLGQIGQFTSGIPAFQGIVGGQQGGPTGASVGYGTDTRKKDIFGNIVG